MMGFTRQGQRPKIAFFLPSLGMGGAERQSIDLRARLRRRGFETSVLVHSTRRSSVILGMDGAEDVVLLGVRGMSQPGGWLRVYRALREARADIIVCVNQTPLITAILTRFLGATKARVACVFHSTVLRDSERRSLPLFAGALRLADALIFVSANQKAYWRERGLTCRRTPVILNGVDLDRFKPDPEQRIAMRRRLGFADQDLVVGLVANFRPEKSHVTLIEALKRLRDRGVPAKVLFVGDGETREIVETLIRRHALADRVVFAGEQTDVRPSLSACDVGVLCSVAVETFSLSALEFLAMGVPMVMSRIGGASELVQDGRNGFLFEVGDVASLADRIAVFTDAAERSRMSTAARSSVVQLSSDAMVDAYVALFDDLMMHH